MEQFKEHLAQKVETVSGINIKPLMANGLIKMEHAREWLIRETYRSTTKVEKCRVVKERLSSEYHLSISAIEKIVYKKE